MEQTARSQNHFRYQTVEKHVMEMVESGVLTPGDRLPSLRQMSLKTNFSLSTTLKAYTELERKGVIVSRPKSGYYVRANFRRLPSPTAQRRCRLAARTVNRSTLIQSVLETISDRSLVPLGQGYPGSEMLPVGELSRTTIAVLKNTPAPAISYENFAGNIELRKQISFRSIDTGALIKPDELIITNGAIEALGVALRVVTRTGDSVLIQSPTYFGFLQLMETMGLRAIEIRSCPEQGIVLSDLKDAVDRFQVSACVLTPNFSNPDGSLTPSMVKEELVSFLTERGVPMIEDDIYGDLYFSGQRPESCKKYDRKGLVLACSSFSKTMAPGYRIGWLGPGAYYDQALKVKTTLNTAAPSLNQIAVAEYLKAGRYDSHLKKMRGQLERNMQALHLRVSRYFPPEVKSTRPAGGLLLWLELPPRVDSKELFFRAKEGGLAITPGMIFTNHNRFDNFIRLGYGRRWTPELDDGLKRLGQMVYEMI